MTRRACLTFADGSDAHALIVGGTSLAGSWSPDGQSIAYARADTSQEGMKVWIARRDGSWARRLTAATAANVDENVPRWAPDGTRIAFTSNQRGRHEIWVVEVASGSAVPLTEAYFDPQLSADIEQKVPAWSPDGRFIAHWSGVGGGTVRAPTCPEPCGSWMRTAATRGAWSMATTRTGRHRGSSSCIPWFWRVSRHWASSGPMAAAQRFCSRSMPAGRCSRPGSAGHRMRA